MNLLQKILAPVLYVVRNHKKTMLVSLISMLIFSVLFFPYEDLSDLVTELIAKNTQNQVFVQFDDLGIGFLPPAIKMNNVTVDTPMVPTVKAGALRLAPSIAGFLAFKPGFTANIDDVMSGDVSLTYKMGKKINDTTQLQSVDLSLSSVDLKKLVAFTNAPMELQGKIDADFDADIDPGFNEQPDGDLTLEIDSFRLPPQTLPTMMGPMSMPDVKLSKVKLKGTLKGGEFNIEEGVIGKAGDTLAGRMKGQLGLRFVRMGNQLSPQIGAYKIKVDLNLDRSAEKNFGIFLSFFDKYKTLTGSGARYAMELSGPNFQAPPAVGPIRGSF